MKLHFGWAFETNELLVKAEHGDILRVPIPEGRGLADAMTRIVDSLIEQRVVDPVEGGREQMLARARASIESLGLRWLDAS